MITKILNRKKIKWWKKLSDFDFFIEYRSEIKNSVDDFFRRSDYESKKKRRIIEKTTKFDQILDIKDYVLCVVYDEIENLSNKFVILQTKKKCQFSSNSKIVDKSIKENDRNEFINSNIKSIASNVLSLITQKRIRFSFDLKNVFSMTRRKLQINARKIDHLRAKSYSKNQMTRFVSKLKNK